MTDGTVLTSVLKRDRAIVLAALVAIALLAWAYVVWLKERMDAEMSASVAMPNMPNMPGMDMSQMAAPSLTPWTSAHFAFMFAMWAVMMVGMMTPTVTPMVLTYARVAGDARSRGRPFAATGWFLGGYLFVWTAFALFATLAQWGLERLALLTPMMAGSSRILGGVILLAVGAFQWTPLKNTCLAQCRAPLSFVQRHGGFKPGVSNALRLGLMHGAYCVGCCWALMALLFVGGVMNLLWIAGLMIFVLLEKTVPLGSTLSRVAGVAAGAAGIWMLAT